jgi:hypothetical protein
MKNGKLFGLLIATTLASASIALAEGDAPAAGGATPAKDKKAEAPYCQTTGKGQSSCKGHGNASCKGQNSCAAQGWVKAKNEKSCTKAGGKWSAS